MWDERSNEYDEVFDDDEVVDFYIREQDKSFMYAEELSGTIEIDTYDAEGKSLRQEMHFSDKQELVDAYK
ncbi:hypothetical protein M569_03643 [Genlisea aurea]|uniref:Uncharacterized protein n=1 Tax=Genlisea aurea TaxID=192259 RepID=S8CUS1_9LAMI|nr:hypothetical protein M569_03643 [Genlisea aurea]